MNKSVIAAAIALLVLGLAVYFGLNRQQQYAPSEAGPAIDNVADRLASASSIVLSGGEQRITLVRQQDGWMLEESGGYPIRVSELRLLASNIQEARRIESRSSNASNYPSYGLGSEDLRSFVALDDSGNTLIQLKIGSSMHQLNGVYALIGDDPQVWIVSGELNMSANPRDWLVREITNIASQEIQRVRLSDVDLISQQGTLVVGDAGEDDPNQPNINQVASALANLRLLDAKSEKPDISGDVGTIEYTTLDGLVITITHGVDAEERYWAQFSAAAMRDRVAALPAQEPPEPVADTSGDEPAVDPQQLLEQRYQQAVAQSEDIHSRLAGFWIQVPLIPGRAFAYNRQDLTKKPVAEEPAGEP